MPAPMISLMSLVQLYHVSRSRQNLESAVIIRWLGTANLPTVMVFCSPAGALVRHIIPKRYADIIQRSQIKELPVICTRVGDGRVLHRICRCCHADTPLQVHKTHAVLLVVPLGRSSAYCGLRRVRSRIPTGCTWAPGFCVHKSDTPAEIVRCRSISRHQSSTYFSRSASRCCNHCAFLVAISGTVQLLTSHHHLLIFAPTDCP
jgi:hypothetical protein